MLKPTTLPIALTLLLLTTTTALAQTATRSVAMPWLDETSTFELRSSALYLNNAETNAGLDTDVATFDNALRWRLDPESRFSPTVAINYSHTDLRSSDPVLPERLIDASIAAGFEFFENQAGDFRLSFVAGAGWAGDNAFSDTEAMYGLASLVGTWELDTDKQLVLLLDYNGNRNFMPDVPLPGIAYRHRVDETVTYIVGLPISRVVWTPDDKLRVTAYFVLPSDGGIDASYALQDDLQLFASLGSDQDAYDVEGLGENRRLFFRQRRAEVGLACTAVENARFTLAAGYAFDQKFTTGFDSRDDDTVTELEDAPYLRVGISVLW